MILKSSVLAMAFVTATGASAYTPPPPPSGPISGWADCLFETGQHQEAGQAQFNERGLPFEGVIPLGEQVKEPQVRFIQFPIDGNELSDVEFGAGGEVTLRAEDGRRVAGKFTPLHRASDDRWWMEFSVPDSVGDLIVTGKCLVDIRGRLERPVRLTEIVTMRVD